MNKNDYNENRCCGIDNPQKCTCAVVKECISQLKNHTTVMYGKSDIMSIHKCKSDKALNMLKLFFQMGYGNKIGKEYYISEEKYNDFIKDFAGKEVFV